MREQALCLQQSLRIANIDDQNAGDQTINRRQLRQARDAGPVSRGLPLCRTRGPLNERQQLTGAGDGLGHGDGWGRHRLNPQYTNPAILYPQLAFQHRRHKPPVPT